MGRRMQAAVLCVALLVAASSVAPGLGAQTSADSVLVYEAAIRAWVTSPSFSHPSGRVEAVCVETLPDWITFSRERDAPPLRPDHAGEIVRVLQDTVEIVAGTGCHVAPSEAGEIRGWMLDESDRPAIRLMVSGLVFEDADTALVHVGMLAGGLWGGGHTCRWVRTEDESWGQRECPGPHWAS